MYTECEAGSRPGFVRMLQNCIWAAAYWACASACLAETTTIPGPIDSVSFGRRVQWLPSGNLVVTDPNAGPSAVGAVYLYRPDGTLLSTLKGGTPNDQIGDLGILVLPTGNFLVLSGNWHNAGLSAAGAVTFVNGNTGLNGTVSPVNSLVGSATNDSDDRQVFVLDNGNYLVLSPLLDFPGAPNRGAITWGSASAGVVGPISVANSLVSPNVAGFNSINLAQLANGNFVLGIPLWNSVGAAVWCPGATGCVGTVEDNVALVGTNVSDLVGGNVVALSNGNYVVRSAFWDDGATANVGAVTWANGTTGLDGSPTAGNSWIGATSDDQIGSAGILPLANGHFVIMSSSWANGGTDNAGAATWVNGNASSSGIVSPANSMVGTQVNDQIGSQYVALPNGNYVVGSSNWANGAATVAGAVRWASGLGGSIGPVTPANALVGGTTGDSVGGRIEALPNGNYVVLTTRWDNGAAVDAGAVTFGPGGTGVTGLVSAANSLVATTTGDEYGGVFRLLANNNFLVSATQWDNGVNQNVGIVTWVNGATGANGVVSGSNSLIGATANDRIGTETLALSNGHYMVVSRNWDGAAVDLGAVTWGNGSTGTSGLVSATNSLVGASAGDGLPMIAGVAMSNGDAVIGWPGFDRGGLANAGALVNLGGAATTMGTLSLANAFVGSSASESLGSPLPTAYSDDMLILKVANWDTGVAPLNVGAVCLLDGGSSLTGEVNTSTCVLGALANLGSTLVADYSAPRQQMAVGLPSENKVVILDHRVFANGFE